MSTISAGTTTTTALVSTGDTTGALVLATGASATTALTLSSAQAATFAGAVTAPSFTTTGGTGSLNSVNTFGFKNRIINGGMVIDQRNAGASVTPATPFSQYVLDRWNFTFSVGSKLSIQQNAGSVTPPVGFSNYMGFTSLSAYTVGAAESFTVRQLIEGFNTADLAWGTANAKTVTLSFWVRSSLTGAFGGYIQNTDSTRSYPYSYTISAANTWEQKTITIAGDTTGTWVGATNGRGISVGFNLGSGSTLLGTANTWAAAQYNAPTGATSVVGTSGATFYITGVQLEVGSQATSFDFRSIGQELILCQRYYEKVGWNQSEVPGATSGYNGACLLLKIQGTTAVFGGSMAWQVLKRATPTITTFGSILSGVETSGVSVDYNTGNSLGATSALRIGERQFTQLGATVDSTYGAMFRMTVVAEL